MSDCFFSFFFFPSLKCSQSCCLSGLCPHCFITAIGTRVESIPLAAAGLEIVSQLDISASASTGLSIRVLSLHLPFGSGGISTALQPVKKKNKNPSQVGTEGFSQSALRGRLLKWTSLLWSDLG